MSFKIEGVSVKMKRLKTRWYFVPSFVKMKKKNLVSVA
jgi:hypothetical protein